MLREHMDPPPKTEKWIENTVGALCDPIIVWPGYEDCVPDKLREDITMFRLLDRMKDPGLELATWPEVCAYMMTFSLAHPPTRDFTEMYEYAFVQYMKMKGVPVPGGFLKFYREELSTLQEQELVGLRRWIYNKGHEVTKSRLKAAKKEAKENLQTESKDQQLQFF